MTTKMTRALLFVLLVFVTTVRQAEAQQCIVPPAGLVSWWPGDGNANDIVGGNDGAPVNGTTFATGKVGQAFSFDGTGFVLIPDSPTLDLTDQITLEFWFNYSAPSSFRGLIAKRNEPGDLKSNYGVNLNPAFLGLGLYYNDLTVTGGDDFAAVGSTFEVLRLPLGGSFPMAGQFHHFAGTYRQVNPTQVEVKMFINGQLVKTLTLPGNLGNTLNDAPVTIGASFPAGEFFVGIIDEVEIYNRALSDDEVRAIFDAGSAGKCKALLLTCVGFEPPMDGGAVTVKKNRVLPLKARLFDVFAWEITDFDIVAPPVISILFDSGVGGPAEDVTDDARSAGHGTEGNQFVFTEDWKWQFNLKTKNYSAAGTYTISMVSGDESEYTVDNCEAHFVTY